MDHALDRSPLRGRPAGILAAIALAAFQVVGTFGAARNQTGHRSVDALAVLLAVAGPTALVVFWARPRTMIWALASITLIYLARDYAYGPVFASLALAGVLTVVRGHRTTAWCAFAAVYAGTLVLHDSLRNGSRTWPVVFGVAAWALLVLAVGEVIRVRREQTAAARETRRESGRRLANEERLRIARELHDVVAHHMSLINVQAGVALHLVDKRPEQAQTALAAIKDASREALVELRSLVGVLRDESDAAPRTPTETLASIDDIVVRSRHAGLVVVKQVDGRSVALPSAVELAAVRIVQEAITNVVRHADAGRATITLAYATGALEVSVTDDGHGMRSGAGPGGSGIIGMRERAEALGGSLDVGPADSGGTRVHARLPIAPDA